MSTEEHTFISITKKHMYTQEKKFQTEANRTWRIKFPLKPSNLVYIICQNQIEVYRLRNFCSKDTLQQGQGTYCQDLAMVGQELTRYGQRRTFWRSPWNLTQECWAMSQKRCTCQYNTEGLETNNIICLFNNTSDGKWLMRIMIYWYIHYISYPEQVLDKHLTDFQGLLMQIDDSNYAGV